MMIMYFISVILPLSDALDGVFTRLSEPRDDSRRRMWPDTNGGCVRCHAGQPDKLPPPTPSPHPLNPASRNPAPRTLTSPDPLRARPDEPRSAPGSFRSAGQSG